MPEPRACDYRFCSETFTPKVPWQRFHSDACKKAYHHDRAHWSPHPCPYCGTMHEPDEPTLITVLERLLAEAHPLELGDSTFRVILASELRRVLDRRRSILHTAEAAAPD